MHGRKGLSYRCTPDKQGEVLGRLPSASVHSLASRTDGSGVRRVVIGGAGVREGVVGVQVCSVVWCVFCLLVVGVLWSLVCSWWCKATRSVVGDWRMLVLAVNRWQLTVGG